MMYMTPADRPAGRVEIPLVARIALVASAAPVFYQGHQPSRVLEWASRSIATIF
jgi:hypothetical protein